MLYGSLIMLYGSPIMLYGSLIMLYGSLIMLYFPIIFVEHTQTSAYQSAINLGQNGSLSMLYYCKAKSN